MILNAVLCDWIRLTTFKEQDYIKFLNAFNNHAEGYSREASHRLQYTGFRTPHGFVGAGTQKRRRHYYTEYSGAQAHPAFVQLLGELFQDTRCTRIDVQATIIMPDGYDAREVVDEFRDKLPHGRRMTLYEDWQQLTTIYMGSRKTKNGRVSRMYIKEWVGGKGLRFEIEYKGGWATDMWEYLRQGGLLEHLFTNELESLGNTDFSPFSAFYELVDGNLPAPRPVRVETSSPKLDWLLNTCEPVIVQMLNDHDHGWKVRHWLESLLDWSR